jgi:hypothetical protein
MPPYGYLFGHGKQMGSAFLKSRANDEYLSLGFFFPANHNSE